MNIIYKLIIKNKKKIIKIFKIKKKDFLYW